MAADTNTHASLSKPDVQSTYHVCKITCPTDGVLQRHVTLHRVLEEKKNRDPLVLSTVTRVCCVKLSDMQKTLHFEGQNSVSLSSVKPEVLEQTEGSGGSKWRRTKKRSSKYDLEWDCRNGVLDEDTDNNGDSETDIQLEDDTSGKGRRKRRRPAKHLAIDDTEWNSRNGVVDDENENEANGDVDSDASLRDDTSDTDVSISERETFQCTVCEKTFKTKRGLQNHGRMHPKEKTPFTKALPGGTENGGKNDDDAKKLDLKLYLCPECKKFYALLSEVRAESEPCFWCHVTSSGIQDFRSELKAKKARGPVSGACPVCDKTFKKTAALMLHCWTHANRKPYECPICKSSFPHRNKLREHQRVHTGEKPFQCATCGRRFPFRQGYISHVRSHTGEQPYVCTQCGNTFKDANNLRRHVQTHKDKNQKMKYQCEYCNKGFNLPCELKEHLRIHTGEKPFKCNECGKAFRVRQALKHHMVVHTREKRFECKVCHKRFAQSTSLNIHTLIHTGEKPHQCEFCQKRFVQKPHLQKHQKLSCPVKKQNGVITPSSSGASKRKRETSLRKYEKSRELPRPEAKLPLDVHNVGHMTRHPPINNSLYNQTAANLFSTTGTFGAASYGQQRPAFGHTTGGAGFGFDPVDFGGGFSSGFAAWLNSGASSGFVGGKNHGFNSVPRGIEPARHAHQNRIDSTPQFPQCNSGKAFPPSLPWKQDTALPWGFGNQGNSLLDDSSDDNGFPGDDLSSDTADYDLSEFVMVTPTVPSKTQVDDEPKSASASKTKTPVDQLRSASPRASGSKQTSPRVNSPVKENQTVPGERRNDGQKGTSHKVTSASASTGSTKSPRKSRGLGKEDTERAAGNKHAVPDTRDADAKDEASLDDEDDIPSTNEDASYDSDATIDFDWSEINADEPVSTKRKKTAKNARKKTKNSQKFTGSSSTEKKKSPGKELPEIIERPLENVYLCKDCNKMFYSPEMKPRSSCPHCHVTLENKMAAFRSEVRAMKKATKYACPVCKETIGGKFELSTHAWRHSPVKRYKCPQCDMESCYRTKVRDHMRVHSGEKPYQCDICGRSFRFKPGYITHMRSHTGERPYTCDKCGSKFKDANNLRQHVVRHNDEKEFKCEFCGKGFHTKYQRAEHLRMHTGEKPFVCAVCGKGFAMRQHWKLHQATHSEARPFQCAVCDKAFKTRAPLQIHARIHTGDKRYQCEWCNKRFTQKPHLKKHQTSCPNKFNTHF